MWRNFIRVLTGVLLFTILVSLFLSLVPPVLTEVILFLPVPGKVRIPPIGPTPEPPAQLLQRGPLPSGFRAYQGFFHGASFSCGFLLEIEGGQRVGVNAAHSIGELPRGEFAEFRTPEGSLAAVLTGQIAHGQPFIYDQFHMDYVVWTVNQDTGFERFLRPDPRGSGQPGERILVYSPFASSSGGPQTYPGVVMSVSDANIWIQLDEPFSPSGFSGCPVISQTTGNVIGMAVAGVNQPPVVMGLHPIGSLVEKARAALLNIQP
jgi:hypothetical protein